jgi:hypothetical protein
MASTTNPISGQHLRYDWRKSKLKENDRITIKIKRNGAEQILQGKIKLPYEEKEALNADATKKTLRTAWLKG